MMNEDNNIALATPTRFLIESGEWKLTPNIGGSIHHEMNPFDSTFQQRTTPTVKTTTDKWSTPSPTALNSNVMYTSPEPEIAALDTIASPPTPPLSFSQSPSSSSASFSLSSEPHQLSSPIQQSNNNMMMNNMPQQYAPPPVVKEETTRRSSRIQTKQQSFFSEYLEGEEIKYKPKTASVQSGRKRRIVFEGDDAEDRRKKFLERNRVAAYKCRQKKKNWMQELEQDAEIQNSHNDELRALVVQLKEESMYLRNLLLTHGNCDCDSVQAYLRKISAEITSSTSSMTAPSLFMSSIRNSMAFPSMPSYPGSFSSSSMPSFPETSTGLTPFLNTVINKNNNTAASTDSSTDYFSHTINLKLLKD